jgi:hypothetical protein
MTGDRTKRHNTATVLPSNVRPAIWPPRSSTMNRKIGPAQPLASPTSRRVVDATTWWWHRLTAWLFDPYRPELHYMRGLGPKWREKHARDVGFGGY